MSTTPPEGMNRTCPNDPLYLPDADFDDAAGHNGATAQPDPEVAP